MDSHQQRADLPRCRRISATDPTRSAFYSLVLHDVWFPALRYHEHITGRPQSVKKEFGKYVSRGALAAQWKNPRKGKLELPFPQAVMTAIGMSLIETPPPRWVLAYNDPHDTSLLCLVPENRLLGSPPGDLFEVDADALGMIEVTHRGLRENEWYSLFADELYVWPEVITLDLNQQGDQQHRGCVFRLAELFLKALPFDYRSLDGRLRQKAIGGPAFFELFFTSAPMLLYFRTALESEELPYQPLGFRMPREIRIPTGCYWSLQAVIQTTPRQREGRGKELERGSKIEHWIQPPAS